MKPWVGYLRKKNRAEYLELRRHCQNTEIKENHIWNRAFQKLYFSNPESREFIEEFYHCKLRRCRWREFHNKEVIAVVAVKNELYRVKKFLEHYRKIGVTQFAFIDNGSSDGTFEFLSEQDDVSLFEVKDDYTSVRREAWINRIVDDYGHGRWYLIADIDELLSYVGIEQNGIHGLIEYAEKKKMNRVRAILLDMYADSLSSLNDCPDPYEDMRYFDTDTYTVHRTTVMEEVRGGFRKRVFHSDALLTKYPLLFFSDYCIQCNSHSPFPYRNNIGQDCFIALMHYKFMPADIARYREIAGKGNYYKGSAQYKQYLNVLDGQKGDFEFKYAGSERYSDSGDLLRTGLIKAPEIRDEERTFKNRN
ncbi:MAG: glycosyltransferase family 2 protein [Blautia sp.]|nr:glycosyltransferase family 2 protein [Blautia sp.]MCM1202164.1 glycosyltransferase family 2 protein [Bacteroides fragilis]